MRDSDSAGLRKTWEPALRHSGSTSGNLDKGGLWTHLEKQWVRIYCTFFAFGQRLSTEVPLVC